MHPTKPSALILITPTMNCSKDNNALVVREDTTGTSSTSAGGVVLDALPYVEPLDPNYENYAISLIEQEMHQVLVTNQQITDHPSLRQKKSGAAAVAAHTNPNFCGKAPMATAAYEALVARREAANNNNEDTATKTNTFTINHPDPMADIESTDQMDEHTLISNLQTSIKSSKIQLEYSRIHHMNLELQQQFETPAKYTSYNTQLETNYLNTSSSAVGRQRRIVDGINGTRMEEQQSAIGKLNGMTYKYETLVEKNRRLDKAVESLEEEVANLRKRVGVSGSSAGDNVDDGDTKMEVAEISKEN